MRIIHKEVSPVNSRSDIWSLSEMNIFRETRWFSWLEVSSERLMLEDEASIESKKVSVNSKVKALMLEIFDSERKLRVWREDWLEKPLVASNNWRIGRIATPSHAFFAGGLKELRMFHLNLDISKTKLKHIEKNIRSLLSKHQFWKFHWRV